MKKFVFLIFFFLFACALFHKSILGAAARYALKIKCDCELAYCSLDWKKGALVFSDLVLFDSTFHTHIEKASLRFDWSDFPKKMKGHLAMDHPHVSILKQRTLPEFSESWFDFTVSVNDGIVEWDGPAHFNYDQNHLALNWGESEANLTFLEGSIEAELKEFKIGLLKSFISFGEISNGHITGRAVLNSEQKLISANLKIGNVDLSVPRGSIAAMEGTFSYKANLGAKWELQGLGSAQGKQFPFVCSGRGFFKRHWIETEILFNDSSCKISGEEIWTIECHDLHSEQTTLLQAGAAVVWPELSAWDFMQGSLNGKANLSSSSWNIDFEGENLNFSKENFSFYCEKALGNITQDGGHLILAAKDYDLKIAGTWDHWEADVRLLSSNFSMHGGWDGEKFPIHIEKGTFDNFHFSGSGWMDPQFDLFLTLEGNWSITRGKIPFYCPHISKKGNDWSFDFRFIRKTWDLLRIAGTYNGKEIFYNEKCHLLGAPLHFAPCEMGSLDLTFQLPWKTVMAAAPFLKEWGVDMGKIPSIGESNIRFQFKEGQTKFAALGTSPPFEFYTEQIEDGWKIDLISDLALHGVLQKDGNAKGKGSWKTGLEVEFNGKIHPSLRCEFSLPKIRFDLAQIDFIKIEGDLQGEGHLIYDHGLESDFDLIASSLKIHSYPIENEGPIHLSYSSTKGALFSGLNLHGPFDCIVDLLEYDACRSHWIFHNSQVHLPGSFLTHRFIQFLDKDHDLNFTADLDFASDFSTFVCTMREGLIPFGGSSHQIENLHLLWDKNFKDEASLGTPVYKCKAALHYLNQLHRVNFTIDEKMMGRLILGEEENPLTIDWEYQDALTLHSIEGSFNGIEASFHAESADTLIGSARLNFTTLSELLPKDIAQVFEEIKMGSGYELKGRLKIEKNRPFFRGILSGKQLELFGFQFRTLLAQADLGPEQIKIYDAKISDSAGMLKIDEILIEGKEKKPWTISIPTFSILDLRPSLLLRPGGTVGPISPLVVRELKMTDFKGLLDDGKTYTAKGQLHFINSYKRGETVFDFPANILSRIVGLDLELLIPVCGDLNFDLKDGYFNLTELTNAFSEGKRSEFFLEMNPPPTMDLDGNLKIFIKMKQFVLLKITESLLISIDGLLDDPQFHLKRRRFFGLM